MRGAILKNQRDRASRALLYGLFVLLPLIVVFGHKGIAPWLLLASLPAFARGDFWQSAFGALFDRPNFQNPFFVGFLASGFFCFWIFVSGFWSPVRHSSLFLNVAAPLLVGGSVVWYSLNLPHPWTYRLAKVFSFAIAGGMLVLAFEGLSGGFLRSVLPPNDPSPDGSRDIIALGRGVTALMPALFPAALIVSMVWNRSAAMALLALGVVAAFSNDVSANAAAIAAGFFGAVIAFKSPRKAMWITANGLLVLLIATPFVAVLIPVDAVYAGVMTYMPEQMQPQFSSWLHRLAVWQNVAVHIPGGLPFGYGADFARAWKETAETVQVPGVATALSVMPTHPHNLFLQLWLELGLPGVIAFGGFIHFGGKMLRNASLPTPVVAACVGALAAVTVSVLVEGSLWQVWRLAAMALAGMGVALSYSLHQGWRAKV